MVEILSWDQISSIADDVDKNFRFPAAQAIVPANPHRLGAAAASSFKEPSDRLAAIEDNLKSAYDFLNHSPSDTVYNDRFATVVDDTLKVNAMAELGGDVGASAAGAYATKRAEFYMKSAITEDLSGSFEGRLRLEILRRNAAKRGITPSDVVGTDIWKQNLPDGSRSNPLFGPYSPGKRPVWSMSDFKPLGFVEVAPIIIRIPCVSIVLSRFLGNYIFNILCLSVSIYYYGRYLLYIERRLRNSILYYIAMYRMKKQIKKKINFSKMRRCNLF